MEVSTITLVFKNDGDIDFKMTPNEDVTPTIDNVKTDQFAQFVYRLIGDMLQGDAVRGVYELFDTVTELALEQGME